MSRRKRKSNKPAIPRIGYERYGLSENRLQELQAGCRSGKYPSETLAAACVGFEFVGPWVLLSVREGKSFDRMQISWDLGKAEGPAVSRSSFYRFRRRFFANLDRELKERGV